MQGDSAAAALLLAAVHLAAGKLHGGERSRWLSAAGGVSAAYVFLHLVPELAQRQALIAHGALHLYLAAFAGFALFYALESAVKQSRGGRGEARAAPQAAFWLHLASFALYNALIGYLLAGRAAAGRGELAAFAGVMAMHLLAVDYGMREHHKQGYTGTGRWVLAAAVPAGWALSLFQRGAEPAASLLLAFLAGALILNVMKEELPAERESRYGVFLVAAAASGALLFLLG